MITCTEPNTEIIKQVLEKTFGFEVKIKGKTDYLEVILEYTLKEGYYNIISYKLGSFFYSLEGGSIEDIYDAIYGSLWTWMDKFSDDTRDYGQEMEEIMDIVMKSVKELLGEEDE